MERPFRHLDVEQRGEVFCARVRNNRLLADVEVHQLAAELLELVKDRGCRKLALSLGPEPLQCLYSVFLAKLVTLRRVLEENGGAMKLCEVHPETFGVFKACRLHEHFDFVPDLSTAVATLEQSSGGTP